MAMVVRGLTAAERSAALCGLAAGIASVLGFVPGMYRDTSYTIAGSHGQDAANVLAVVVLVCALVASSGGSMRGRLIAIGAVGYLLYSYMAYAYMMMVNPASLLYYAVIGFAVAALSGGLASVEDHEVARVVARLPKRTVAVVLVATALLFAFLWLGQIAATVTGGTLPADLLKAGWPTSPYYANDLAIVLPLFLVAGVWLFQGRPAGRRLAVPLLVFAVLMDLSIFATLVSGSLGGEATFDPAIGSIFLGHAMVNGGLALAGMRSAAVRA